MINPMKSAPPTDLKELRKVIHGIGGFCSDDKCSASCVSQLNAVMSAIKRYEKHIAIPDETPADVSLCQGCGCMTHTIKGKCGKCQADKAPDELKETVRAEILYQLLAPKAKELGVNVEYVEWLIYTFLPAYEKRQGLHARKDALSEFDIHEEGVSYVKYDNIAERIAEIDKQLNGGAPNEAV